MQTVGGGWALLCLAGWLCAAVLGIIFTRLAIALAPKLGLVDKPHNEAHKNHGRTTAVGGGSAMFLAWAVTLGLGALGLLWLTSRRGGDLPDTGELLAGLGNMRRQMCLLLGGTLVLTAVGLLDDIRPMKAGRKFLWQILVAAVTAYWGPRLTFGCHIGFLTWAVTAFWIVTIINALNFFDNMDGLAGGTAAIACFFFLIVACLRGQFLVSGLAAVTGGCICGFLWYNRPPARIFMGDSGSHLLGYLLAVISILTTFYVQGESTTIAPVLIPLLVLGLPLFDAMAVIAIRLKLHQPLHIGDNRHLSHRFAAMGLTRPQSVLLILLLNCMAGTSALTLLWLPPIGDALIFLQLAAALAVISLIQFFVKK